MAQHDHPAVGGSELESERGHGLLPIGEDERHFRAITV